MNRRFWSAAAGIVAVEVLVLSVLTSIALRFPGIGVASFMMTMAVVCYAATRYPLAVTVVIVLMNALMLAFYAQSVLLPTALLLLLVAGIMPYVTQLSYGLSRLALSTAFAGACVLLSLVSWGGAMAGVRDFVLYVVCSLVAGLACSALLVGKTASRHV